MHPERLGGGVFRGTVMEGTGWWDACWEEEEDPKDVGVALES